MHLCVRLCQHERALCLTLAHICMLRASLFAHNVNVGSGREGQSWNYQTRLFCQRKKKLENKVNAWNDSIFESDWKCLVLLFSFGVCPTAEPQWEMNQKGKKKNAASVSRPTFSFPVLHVSQCAGYLGLIVSHSEPFQHPSSVANRFARSASCWIAAHTIHTVDFKSIL